MTFRMAFPLWLLFLADTHIYNIQSHKIDTTNKMLILEQEYGLKTHTFICSFYIMATFKASSTNQADEEEYFWK